MLGMASKYGGAAILAAGLVVSVTEPTAVAQTHSADIQLTATVLGMGGLGYETLDPALIRRAMGGYFADEESVIGLAWPGEMAPWNGTLTLDQSVTVGLENMEAAIAQTPGRKFIVGASGATLVVNEVMRHLADDPNAPPADEMSFVVLGDADRGVFKQVRGLTLPIFDYTVQQLPVTKYDLLVVAGEYDGLGDWPDRPWNLLAVLNALAGTGLLQQVIDENIVDTLELDSFGSVHYDAMFADLTQVPAKNITTTVNAAGGTTTSYLVPTADLPLLRPLKPLGVPQAVIDILEAALRPVIDSAYVRNDPWRQPLPFGSSAATRPDPPEPVAARVAAPAGAVVEQPTVVTAPTPPATPIALPAAARAVTGTERAARGAAGALRVNAKAGKRQTAG